MDSCADEHLIESASHSEHHSDDNQENCPPFCVCQSYIASITFPSFSYHLAKHFSTTKKEYFSHYKSHYVSSYSHSIWHPPTFS